MAIAPVSAGVWKVARDGSANAWNTISIDPAATSNSIRSAFLSAAVMCALIALGRVRSSRRMIVTSLGIAGALILVCGLCQIAFRSLEPVRTTAENVPQEPTLRIDPPIQTAGVGVVQVMRVGDYTYRIDRGEIAGLTGPYLYANHFAGGLCVTLPVLITGCICALRGRVPIALNWGLAIGLAVCGVWAVATFARSRAGTASLIVALLVLFAAVVPKGWLRAVLCSLAAVAFSATGAFLLLLLGTFGNSATWLPTFAKPLIPDFETDARAASARVAVRAFLASPILGTGLDTYADVFPRFYKDGFTLFYAHNDYAQLLAECGIVGAILCGIAVVALLFKARKFFLDASGDYRTVNSGVWAGLLGIATHSAFDWNLHLPANAFLGCVAAAMAYSSVPSSPRQDAWQQWIDIYLPLRVLQLVLIVSLAVSSGLFIRDAMSDVALQTLRRSLMATAFAKTDLDRSTQQTALTTSAERALRCLNWDTANSHLLTALGQAQLHLAADARSEASRDQHLSTSTVYFLKARQASAMVRGLPDRDGLMP